MPEHVDVVVRMKRLFHEIHRGTEAEGTCVVDEYVDAAERRFGFGEQTPHVGCL